MPKYLAGRGEIPLSAELNLKALSEGYQTQPVTFYGLPEVGKPFTLIQSNPLPQKMACLCAMLKSKRIRGPSDLLHQCAARPLDL